MTDVVHDPALVRLGKNEPKADPRTLKLAKYLAAAPPAPPAVLARASVLVTSGGLVFPMAGNDRYGDCTCATASHLIEFWTALAGSRVEIGDDYVLAEYAAITGFNESDPNTDNGAQELDVLNHWRKNGFAGHNLGAYAAVNVTDLNEVKWATWVFDGLYIGIALPTSAQRQDVWDVPAEGPNGDGEPNSWGGHAVNVVDYNDVGPVVVTWGALKQMTWAFWSAYVDEAYALLSSDTLSGSGKTAEGFDLAALQDDLSKTTGTVSQAQ